MLGASRILEKGPDYLRKQMELESEAKGRVSAVERLAATKPKYVKSQQMVNPMQQSVVGSASVSGPSNRNEQVTSKSGSDTVNEESTKVEIVKRNSSKKRPDSLLLYRQKGERDSPGGNNKRNLNKRILLNSLKEKPLLAHCKESTSEQNTTKDSLGLPVAAGKGQGNDARLQPTPFRLGVDGDHLPRACRSGPTSARNESERETRRGVARSHSDISSRYSKNFADFDAFFKYCGLEEDVIDSVGKDNFSLYSEEFCAKIRSVSTATSDDGCSRSSGDSDQKEEPPEKPRQGSSVIERNARIIKWLYSCRNATESGKVLRELD
ncbi:protein FAM110C [Brachyhypopomus gauderio]|uniref:protein FAM110C n=1 Tax=Brachyhypopomus gauderio TaxID=698409 RepID=UPI004043481E